MVRKVKRDLGKGRTDGFCNKVVKKKEDVTLQRRRRSPSKGRRLCVREQRGQEVVRVRASVPVCDVKGNCL